MKKINLKNIAREINSNNFAPKKWEFETIEQSDETKDTFYGKMTKYLVTIKFNAGKYDNNGMMFQVSHYENDDVYSVYFDGTTYLG